MATVASVSNSAFANATSTTVTKPTGLAVGDLMLAHCAFVSSGLGGAFNTPSGWTLLANKSAAGGEKYQYIFTKVANSSDVAASNFTFSVNTTAYKIAAGIMRITGYSSATPSTSSTTADNVTSGTLTMTGITPVRANELVIILASGGDQVGGGTDVSFSSPAVATSNPTWTTAWNTTDSTGFQGTLYGAYATRPEVTATGNATVTYANGTSIADIMANFIVIDSSLAQAHSPSVISIYSNPPVLVHKPIAIDSSVSTATATSVIGTTWTPINKA